MKPQGNNEDIEMTRSSFVYLPDIYWVLAMSGPVLEAEGWSLRVDMVSSFSWHWLSVCLPPSPNPSLLPRKCPEMSFFLVHHRAHSATRGLQAFCWVRSRLFSCSSLPWAQGSRLSSITTAFKVRGAHQNSLEFVPCSLKSVSLGKL